jgi:hypothetical protein
MLAIAFATILSVASASTVDYQVLHPGSIAQVYFDDTPVQLAPYGSTSFTNKIDITGSLEPCPWTYPCIGQLTYNAGVFSLTFPYHYTDVVTATNNRPFVYSQFREIEFLSGYETFTILPQATSVFKREYYSEWCSFEK